MVEERVSDAALLERWNREVGRNVSTFHYRGYRLFVTKDGNGILYFDHTQAGVWGGGRPARNIPLARFIGARYNGGVCLLNGDGLEGFNAQEWQTQVRDAAQAEFGWEHCAVVPYMALRGAGINPETFKLIHVTQDEIVRQNISVLPIDGREAMAYFTNLVENHTTDRLLAAGFVSTRVTTGYNSYQGEIGNNRWQVRYREERLTLGPRVYRLENLWLWAQPEHGALGWQQVRIGEGVADTEGHDFWISNVHRLGACVFRAHGPEGKNHRWVSAFDQAEPEPLYYLAQLPDRGVCKTYDDAIKLLAPEIVHHARKEGKRVERQGDVFAIETNMTDEQVYSEAKTRVRREIALQEGAVLLRQGMRPQPPAEGEIRERVACACCNSRPWGGHGPNARRALSIFRTGHTASEVVVRKDGVTFIRGIMYHDPQIETPGRRAEHRQVSLGFADQVGSNPYGGKWYIAIRNTVPRARPARAPILELQDGTEGQQRVRRQRNSDQIATLERNRRIEAGQRT